MPKIKTNRTAYKKLKVGGKGRVKRAQANKSHNTAKKSANRMRRLGKKLTVNDANMATVKKLIPGA